MEWALGGMTVLAGCLAWKCFSLSISLNVQVDTLIEYMAGKGVPPPSEDDLERCSSVVKRKYIERYTPSGK